MNRREFLRRTAGTVAASRIAAGSMAAEAWLSSTVATAGPPSPLRAVVFDAFPIFDPRPVYALAEKLFPGQGAALSDAWRTRQFEYQWLRSLTGRYADFWQATEDGLVYAARLLRLNLTSEARAQLMDSYLRLDAWPDVPPALQSLREAGLRLAFLSNMTPRMLQAGIRNAGLTDVFDFALSTDTIRAYKPEPRAYQMALDAFHCRREEILYAAFAGWDAAGARAFGYPTFWVNRLGLPQEELGITADATGRDLTDLVTFVAGRQRDQ